MDTKEPSDGLPPGGLLPRGKCELPSVPLLKRYEGGSFFYERECYKVYCGLIETLLEDEPNSKCIPKGMWRAYDTCVTVTGSPGIGISTFYAFCFKHFQRYPNWIIIAQSFFEKQPQSAAIWRDGAVSCVAYLEDIKAEVAAAVKEAGRSQKTVLFLCEGAPDMVRRDGHTVVFVTCSDPWMRKYAEVDFTYYLPPWTLDELQKAAFVLEYDIDADILAERFGYFGGVARQCLLLDSAIAAAYLDEITDSIMTISSRTDLLELLSGKEGSVTHPMHFVPRADNRTFAERQFASEFVAEKLAGRLNLLAKGKKKAAARSS